MATNEVRLAIVGVGNCASALVQGLEYYKDADPTQRVPGLMHVNLGPYHVGDVRVVQAPAVRMASSPFDRLLLG